MKDMVGANMNLSSPGNTSGFTFFKESGSDYHGIFQRENPMHFSFSLLLIQIVVVIVMTRSLGFLLKPLNQPRVVGEIIGGILLGPTALGRNRWYSDTLFPQQSLPILETFAQMGLLLFLFIVGLELDVKALRRTGVQSVSLAAGGIALPLGLAGVVSIVAHKVVHSTAPSLPFAIFMGVAMADTAFPVLARILGERKLLRSELGQLAMSAAAINDVVAWILLALAVGLSGTPSSPAVAAYTFLCTFGYILFSFLVTGPVMKVMLLGSPEKEGLNEIITCITLGMLFLSGLATDIIGIHPVFGAFIFGLVIPKDGPSAGILIEKLEDLVSIVLLPLFFASSGLKTSLGAIQGTASIGLLFLIIATACAGKILGTMSVAHFQNIDLNRSFLLGVLMNTKGLTELVILNTGKDIGILNDEIFAILVIMALVMTVTTTPLLIFLYKPVKDLGTYRRRSLDADVSPPGLNILCCIHGTGTKNMPSMKNLAETVRGTRKHDALHLCMLHLHELSQRGSLLLPVRSFRFKVADDGGTGWVCGLWNGNSEAARNFRSLPLNPIWKLSSVTVTSVETVSEIKTMHEDVCNTALENQSAMVILPYHKHHQVDGGLETTHPGHRTVICKVLETAPCSVGILIDRGFGNNTILVSQAIDFKAVVLFFGGPDDREAVAFCLRMAEHPGVKLDVVRFTPDFTDKGLSDYLQLPDLSRPERTNSGQPRKVTPFRADVGKAQSPNDRHRVESMKESNAHVEKHLDDAVCAAVIANPSVHLTEVAITDLKKGILSICSNNQYNMILAGHNLRSPSPLLLALTNPVYESTEIGPIADILTEDEVRASILIVQMFDYSKLSDYQNPPSSGHTAKDIV